MLALLNEPSFIRNIGDRGVRTIDQASTYIEQGPVASYDKYGFGLLLVTLKESQTPIGICGLIKRDELEDVDIGFAFQPAFWSQGYAYESALAVEAYARSRGRSATAGCHHVTRQPGIDPRPRKDRAPLRADDPSGGGRTAVETVRLVLVVNFRAPGSRYCGS